MKMFKRSLAVILVVLMAFSSVSICGFAADVKTDFSDSPAESADFNYGVTTKFFEKVGGNWVPSDGLVKRGDEVKARVYLETNYFTGSADLVFAFESAFYSFDYPDTAVMNEPDRQPALADYNKVKVYSEKQCGNLINKLKERKLVSEEELEGYGFVAVAFEYASSEPVVRFGDIDFDTTGAWEDKWAFELDFTVKANADSEKNGETGDLIVLPGTVQSKSAQGGFVNLPSAAEGTKAMQTNDAYLWYEQTPLLVGDPQKVVDSVTFFANGGKFSDSTDTKTAYGYVGDEVDESEIYNYFGIDKPTNGNAVLLGWKEADKDGKIIGDDFIEEIEVATAHRYFAAVWDETAAYSSVSFYKNDGTDALFTDYTGLIGDEIEYTDSEPERTGYTFKGWSQTAENGNPETVPTVFPDESANYYAVWQLNNYNLQYYVPSDAANYVFEAYGPAVPVGYGQDVDLLDAPADSFIPDGYYFVGWKQYDPDTHTYTDAPETMPAEGLNLYALCVAEENPVKYYVDGQQIADLSLETDAVLPTDSASLFVTYEGPKYDSDYFDGWYTNESCTEKLADGATVPAGGLKLYAKTSIPANFYKNLGDAAPYKTTYAPFNGEITLPDAPTKADGTFTGWNPTPTIMDSATGKDFFATWGSIDYTASYYIGENTNPDFVETITYEEEFDEWEPPYKPGYTFDGWSWSKADGTPISKPDTMPAENLIAKGDYTAIEYKVTYYVDGKAVNTKDKLTVGTEIGDYTYKNTGYADITEWNWSYTNEKGNKVTLSTAPVTMLPYDLVAEAASTPNKNTLTITYTGAGDDTPATYTAEVAYGTEYKVDTPVVEGYTPDKAAVSGTMPNNEVNETVTYTPNNYTITYKVDGKSYEDPVTVKYGDAVTAKAEPTKEGYTFSGWTWKDAEGTEITKPSTMPAGNITAEGTFTVNKNDVVFKNDDGTEIITIPDVPYGSEMPTIADPKKEGYTFTGWSPAIPETMPDKPVEYVATYKVNPYKVTYKLNGGNIDGATADVEKTVNYGDAIPTIANPTREGYTFDGWDPAVSGTMPAKNLEFTAKWKENVPGSGNYTVNVYLMDTDGTYPTAPSYSKDGSDTIGKEIKVSDYYTADTTNFTLDSDKANVTTGTIGDNTVNLVAYYKRNTSEITWNANGGKIDGKDSKTVTVYNGAAVVAPTATKEGYTFKGWDKEIVSPAAGNATYTAQWDKNNYDVIYRNEDGTILEQFNEPYGENLPAPTNEPTKEGNEFKGWDIDGDGKPDKMPATVPEDGIDAKPVFEPNDYTATFDANGGKFPEGAKTTKDITYGDEITPDDIGEPTREGYTFKGWSTNPTATEGDKDLGKMDSTDGKTIYAAWEKNEYTITYDAGDGEFADGTDEDTATYGYGDTIVKHEQPTKEGFSFDGWEWKNDKDEVIAEPTTMPAGDLKATAKYTERHKAIFYKDYENDKTDIASQSTGDVGEPIPAPTTPSKEGYTFDGWYEIDKDGNIGTEKVTDFGKYSETDKKYTAKWTPTQVDVTFNANGGKFTDGKSSQTSKLNVGTAIEAPAMEAQRAGYEFKGWSTNPTATEPDENLGNAASGGNTFYAVWQAAEHKVTFDANGGKFGSDPTFEKGYNYGSVINAPATNPTREGFTFKGWAEAPDATNPMTSLGTMPDSDKTFYAVWGEKEYNVYYYTEDGSTPSETQSYKKDAVITPPADPTKEGNTFNGWKWYDANKNEITAPTTMPEKDLIAIAQWTKNKYTVTYDPNGGTIDGKTDKVEFKDCEYESNTPTVTSPVKEGYLFTGWSPAYTDKVKGNVNYVAQWKELGKDEFTITYKDENGNVIQTVPYKAGAKISDVTPPAKEGYTPDGWTWSKADGTVISKPDTMPSENLTATAKYKKGTDTDEDLDIFDIITPEGFGKIVDDVVNYIFDLGGKLPGQKDKDKPDDGKKDDDNKEHGSDIPNTGSASGIVVFATISAAAGAAYVFATRKKDDDDNED